MRSEPGWPVALERAASCRIALVLGDTDSGKTSLTTFLAGGLAGRGLPVGVVDADLGQSQIGPPTTVGLGRVTRPIESLADAELLALCWVGSTSPPGFERPLWDMTRRLVNRAAAVGLRPILVDTCGLVRGALGRSLKVGKIRHVEPDLVICLPRADECEPILHELASGPRTEVLTLPVGPAVRRRSHDERRRRREGALEAYFAGARTREVALATVAGGIDGRGPLRLVDDLADTVVGLLDDDGETLGIGRIIAVDLPGRQLQIETPVTRADVARVVLGTEKFRSIHEVIR